MILFYSVITVWWLCQGTHGQFPQYFYNGLSNQYIGLPLIQPQIYYQNQKSYYTQNLHTTIKPAVLARSISPFSDSYRGFSYHTAYENGATATVVFLRSSATNHLRSITNRITIASDILDPQSNLESQIREAFEGPHSKISLETTGNSISDLSPLVKALLENTQSLSTIDHFYSVEGYPANTRPLVFVESLNNKTVNETNIIDDKETAESMETQIKLNIIADEIKINDDENVESTNNSNVTNTSTIPDDVDVTSTTSPITTETETASTEIIKSE